MRWWMVLAALGVVGLVAVPVLSAAIGPVVRSCQAPGGAGEEYGLADACAGVERALGRDGLVVASGVLVVGVLGALLDMATGRTGRGPSPRRP